MKQKKTTIRKVINYLQLSTMEPREKAMWMLMLPHMEEEKLAKLERTLEKEVNAITDLYLEASSVAQKSYAKKQK